MPPLVDNLLRDSTLNLKIVFVLMEEITTLDIFLILKGAIDGQHKIKTQRPFSL